MPVAPVEEHCYALLISLHERPGICIHNRVISWYRFWPDYLSAHDLLRAFVELPGLNAHLSLIHFHVNINIKPAVCPHQPGFTNADFSNRYFVFRKAGPYSALLFHTAGNADGACLP